MMTNNPFDLITTKLESIENLLLDLKHPLPGNPEAERILNIKEAAGFLGLTVPTLYTKVSKNEIPFMKRSGRLYFSTDELKAYLKAGRRATRQEMKDNAHEYLL